MLQLASCNIKMFKPIRLKVKLQIFYVGGLDVRKFPPHIFISMKSWTLDLEIIIYHLITIQCVFNVPV